MKPFVLALALTALSLAAQQPAHRIEKLTDRIYVISGPGGNIGLVVTSRHAVLIDDQSDRLAPQLLDAIRTITDKPIKYLINTHHHSDHTGGNAVLEKHVSAIISHANARQRMLMDQEKLDPSKRGGLPELTLSSLPDAKQPSLMAIHVDGLEIHLYHSGIGHTDGDLTVGIPSAGVIHLGDLFFNGTIPYIDLDAGGSLSAMAQRIDEFCAWIPDNARIIPGHGPVATKNDLVRYRTFLKDVEAHVAKRPGKSGADLLRSFEKTKWNDIKDLGGFLTWEMFMDLAAGRKPKFVEPKQPTGSSY